MYRSKHVFIGIFTVISLIHLYGNENTKLSKGENNNKTIALVGKQKISSKQLIGSSPERLKQSLKEELIIENKLTGENIPTDDESLGKLVLIIQKCNLKKELQNAVDESLELEVKVILDKDVKECFIKKSENSNFDYKYEASLKNAYEYMDKYHDRKGVVKEAYDKFLKNTLGLGVRKGEPSGLEIWQSYVKNKKMRRQIMNQYTYYKNLLERNMTDEIKGKIRHKIFLMHPEKKISYILKKCAETNGKVKKYLGEKNKTGKMEKDFEQEVIDRWYLEQLKKLGCELYTDKYGTLEKVMTFKKPSLLDGGTD